METEWLLEVGLGDVEKRNQPEEGSEQEFVSGLPPHLRQGTEKAALLQETAAWPAQCNQAETISKVLKHLHHQRKTTPGQSEVGKKDFI